MNGPEWKAGQRAVIGRSRVVTIERVTPSGRAIVDGETYNRNGTRRGETSAWRASMLELLTPEIVDEMALTDRARKARQEADALLCQAERWLREALSYYPGPPYVKANMEKAERIAAALRAILGAAP